MVMVRQPSDGLSPHIGNFRAACNTFVLHFGHRQQVEDVLLHVRDLSRTEDVVEEVQYWVAADNLQPDEVSHCVWRLQVNT